MGPERVQYGKRGRKCTKKNYKKTYYQIPTGVFWGMILCILVLLVLEIHSGYRLTEQESNNAFENENQIRIEVTYDDWLSELEDTSQCLLCQENSLAEMTYKSGRDTIGLILLNSWTVLDFQLNAAKQKAPKSCLTTPPDSTMDIPTESPGFPTATLQEGWQISV